MAHTAEQIEAECVRRAAALSAMVDTASVKGALKLRARISELTELIVWIRQ